VPVYVYRRDDGSTFEIEQRMTADPLLNCPTTGQKVARVLQPFTPALQGHGLLLDGPPEAQGRREDEWMSVG
jgi:putative FmdB family regulatory protein